MGVVNQTTQLATDTQDISDYLKNVIIRHYKLNAETIGGRFADTRDTLCYATNDNQTSVTGMLETEAGLAIVIGGHNSSNTSHLVELCEAKLPTYFIDSADRMVHKTVIENRNWQIKVLATITDYLPDKTPFKILITSGASCPDAVVETLIRKLAGFYGVEEKVNVLTEGFV